MDDAGVRPETFASEIIRVDCVDVVDNKTWGHCWGPAIRPIKENPINTTQKL